MNTQIYQQDSGIQVDAERYLTNAKGHLVPKSTIDEIDLARHELVKEMVNKAELLQASIASHRATAFGDVQAFIDLSAEQYDKTIGGGRGNLTLMSFDGCLKVQRSIQDNITFDERLQAAKTLIDRCLHRWADSADDKIKVLVMDAFQVDKEGRVSTGKVLGLRRHKFDDTEWLKAMEAISDSVQVASSKSFIRYYKRAAPDQPWQAISLDIAKL